MQQSHKMANYCGRVMASGLAVKDDIKAPVVYILDMCLNVWVQG